jgi:hypothetical protein
MLIIIIRIFLKERANIKCIQKALNDSKTALSGHDSNSERKKEHNMLQKNDITLVGFSLAKLL